MPVSESLMKAGRWSVRLKESTPAQVLHALDWDITPAAGFGHVFIYTTRIRLDEFADADRKALAIYAGILRQWTDARSIGGPGLVAWLGDENDKGAILETAVTQAAPASLGTWIAALRPSSIGAGTVTNTGTNYPASGAAAFQWVTPRRAIEAVCLAVGAEYRINPDATLDAAAPATLFGATPTGIVTRTVEDRQIYTGIRALELETLKDLDDYTTRVRAITKTAFGSANGAATPYNDMNGNNVVMTRVVEAPESDDATAAATAIINKFSSARKGITLSTDTYSIHGHVKVGESIYVHDLRAQLFDTANQLTWGGEVIHPVVLRIYGMDWPIRQGMGVAFRDGDGVWTDLTDYVDFASEGVATRLTVGGPMRILDGDPAYAGTAVIMPSVEEGQWVTFVPRIDQSNTNIAHTVQYARYRRKGSEVTFELAVTMTAAGVTANTILVYLPFNSANVGNVAIKAGQFVVYDASAGQVYSGPPITGAAGYCYSIPHGAGVAALGAGFALASGDQIGVAMTYEIAVT